MAATSVPSDASNNSSSIILSTKELEPDPPSFIRDCAYSPAIAVLTSFDVESVCEKNNLSFCEVLLPFTQLANEAVVKDPNNQNILIKHLRLDFRDLRRDGYLSNSALQVALGELLREYQSPTTGDNTTDGMAGGYKSGSTTQMHTPWYDAYRRQCLQLMDPPDYEFNRHYLACILVVSTMHEDPLDQLNRLSQAQHALQHQQQNTTGSVQLPKHTAAPKWFSPNTFKYHLLLHDMVDGDDKKAESVYQGMKMNYGAHACHLLRINSASPANTQLSHLWTPFLRYRLRNFNNLRVNDDENDSLKENNNTDETATTTIVNGDMVLVGDGQPDKMNNLGTTIPHPLSCGDLLNLENQQNMANLEKDERSQTSAYGCSLSASDIDRIKIFVQEFSVRGLLPYVERQLRLLNEQVAARRGLHKTFLSFTKNLWGKTGPTGSSPNLQTMSGFTSSASSSSLPSPEKATGPVPAVTFAYESAEMQTRRLADLAALFHNYDFAYQLYHGLKKEFGTAQAWIHSASAMEFASLCVYLAGPSQSRPYPSHYMDQAINTYLAVFGSALLSVRASIFSTAILCAMGEYGQAAAQYIRLSSGDDLRSALFLEQAAGCFLRAGLKRKAALHLILAGHRYGKAAKKQHTVRCYQAALKSHYGKGWKFALDHIYTTLGQEVPDAESEARWSNRKQQTGQAHSKGPWFPKHIDFPQPGRSREESSVETGQEDARISTCTAINCRLTFQPMIEHDFVSDGLCRVPVSLEIENWEDAEELMVRAYAGGMSSPGEFQQFYRGYPLILWSSSCRRILSNSVADQSCRMDLMAVATGPGIYDVSSLKLSCRRKDSKWEDLPLLQSQFITVIQTQRMEYSQARADNQASIYYTINS